jgi:hypothetical protein
LQTNFYLAAESPANKGLGGKGGEIWNVSKSKNRRWNAGKWQVPAITANTNLWRGDLSPLGGEAAPNPFKVVHLIDRIQRLSDCCAAERG